MFYLFMINHYLYIFKTIIVSKQSSKLSTILKDFCSNINEIIFPLV